MFVHFVSSEKHPQSHTKNYEVKDKIFLLLRECYSLLRGVVGAELNNFSIRYLAFTLPPQRIQLIELTGRKSGQPVLVMANVYEIIQE
jgi:hypothetical protein